MNTRFVRPFIITATILLATIQLFGQSVEDQMERQRPKDIPMYIFVLSRYIEDLLCVNETKNKSFIVEPNELVLSVVNSSVIDTKQRVQMLNSHSYRITTRCEVSDRNGYVPYFMIRATQFSDSLIAQTYLVSIKPYTKTFKSIHKEYHSLYRVEDWVFEILYTDKRFERRFKHNLKNQIVPQDKEFLDLSF